MRGAARARQSDCGGVENSLAAVRGAGSVIAGRRRGYGPAGDGLEARRLARNRYVGARVEDWTAAVLARPGPRGDGGMVAQPTGLTETSRGAVAIIGR